MPILDADRALPSLAPTVRVAAWVSLAATLPTGLAPFGPNAISNTFNTWRGVLLPLLGGWISASAVCALVFLAAEALGLRRYWIVRALAVICLTKLILDIVAVSAQTDWFAILHRLGLDGILTTRAQKLLPRNVLYAALGGWLIYKTRNSDFLAKAIRFLRNVVIVFFLILIWRTAPLMFLTDEPVNTALSQPVENSGAYRPFIGDRAVVWVIFDALDYQIAFQEMSPQQLPHFHALAKRGLSAANAYSPGNNTTSSIPQLLTGTSARVEKSSAHSTLKMFPKSGALWTGGVTVRDLGNVFSAVHSRGGSSEVFGYYLPYCDWSPEVEVCQSFSTTELPSWRAVALNSLHDLSLGVVYKFLPINHLDGMTEITHKQSRYLENAFSAGSATLQFIHLNIPHLPAYVAGEYFHKPRPTDADAKGNYLLNVAFSDHVLGQLMTKVEAAAQSKNILLVVSSDHAFRLGDEVIPDGDLRKQHVPFILWQRGNGEGRVITTMFNTIITRRVIEAYLEGSVNKLEDIASFINSNNAKQ